MDKLIDYTKYTIAMAVGLLLYIPANFLPTESLFHHWILGMITSAAGISALAGILFYTRATRVALDNQTTDPKGWMKMWGNAHMWLLVVSYALGGAYFLAEKVVAPEPESECSVTLPQAAAAPLTIKFRCSGATAKP